MLEDEDEGFWVGDGVAVDWGVLVAVFVPSDNAITFNKTSSVSAG